MPSSQHFDLTAPPQRRPRQHLMALRSRLGKAAAIGGLAYVERIAYSDEVAAIFISLDASARKQAMKMILRVSEKAVAKPSPRKPSIESRVKVRWTDDMVARFRAEAPVAKTDVELAARLGLPPYCRGVMRAARSLWVPSGNRYGAYGADPHTDPH